MPETLPEKRENYYTIGGSGELNDYTAIALFEGQDGKREAVIGITLKNIPEVSGFVAFIAEKFGTEHQYKPAMLELPMIYWKGGTLEIEALVIEAINQWIDSDEDPCECFYDNLEDLDMSLFIQTMRIPWSQSNQSLNTIHGVQIELARVSVELVNIMIIPLSVRIPSEPATL
jgi:hypothetical protein